LISTRKGMTVEVTSISPSLNRNAPTRGAT
jgi:hypothetical protein